MGIQQLHSQIQVFVLFISLLNIKIYVIEINFGYLEIRIYGKNELIF